MNTTEGKAPAVEIAAGSAPSTSGVGQSWWNRARDLMGLSWPLVLSATSTMLMQLADALFLGHWSAQSLAAVTPAGIWVFLLTALAQGPVAYVSTFIAQARGAQKEILGERFAWQALWLALLLGSLLTLSSDFASSIFHWIGHPPEVAQEELTYASTCFQFSWITLLNQAFTAIFVGRGRLRLVGLLQFASLWVNVLFDWVLIFGMGPLSPMGIEGAALGTVAASALPPLVLGLLFLKESFTSCARPDGMLIARLCRYGFAEGMRLFTDVGIWTVFTFLIGRLGTEALAANNLVIRITSLVWLPLYGLGRATGQLTAVAIGAKRTAEAQRTVWTGSSLGVLWASAWGVAMALVPLLFLGLFPLVSEAGFRAAVLDQGSLLLIWAALLGLFDAFNMVSQGGLLGAGDARWTMRTLIGVHSLMLIGLFMADHWGARAHHFWMIACADQLLLSLLLLGRLSGSRWFKHDLTEGLETHSIVQE